MVKAECDSEENRYVEFLRTKGHPDAVVFLNNLYEYLTIRAAEVLDPPIIKALSDAEAANDPDLFIDIFMSTKSKAEITTGNFLYHRWIRMLTLARYSHAERNIIESIPIAFIPFYPVLEAFITRTPYGSIICFTHALNAVLLHVFMTLAKSIRFQHYTPKKPQLAADAAVDQIIALARYLIGGCREEELPPKLDLEDHVVNIADRINNITQTFILAHEYNHFLMGHLKNTRQGSGIVTHGAFKHMESYHTDLQQEIEADELAVRLLKKSNQTPDGIQHNAELCGGVFALFLFVAICKKLLGFGTDVSRDHRIVKIYESAFDDNDHTVIMKELNILMGALDKI
ncbi:MAG: hypothetical protein A2521_07150 [Deltaproteobacteria bacterium RIFOXYD12_FULL_57_12]|nr:MAG: hypothetical protein A2521_07150 [Deltaproteobacteria bacterium RIFOXYD12_FULL_57_12]